MSTPARPDLPSVPTNPKITSSSMTPVSPLGLPPEDSKVKGFEWAGFGTALLGVVFWGVKELGGLAALKDLPPLVIIAVAMVFVAAAAYLSNKSQLDAARVERTAMYALLTSRDAQQTGALNEHNILLERYGLLVDRVHAKQVQTYEETIETRKEVRQLARALGHLDEEEDKTPPEARPPRRSGTHEQVAGPDNETPTGRYRRTGKRT